MSKDSFNPMTWLRPGALRLKFAVVLGVSWLILALALRVLADAAPPEQAPGSSIGPEGVTQVRMMAERVILDIHASEPDNQGSVPLADDRAMAQVSATFLMRNLGQASEQMQVRFPLQDASHSDYNYPTDIEGFRVWVDGQPVATTTITGLLPSTQNYIDWAAFPVLFPPDQDVTIEVSYLTRPTGDLPAARFGYFLETGAGWRDTIGSVDIIARLPYPASEENVLLGPYRTDGGDQTTPGGQFVGNEVRWHWDDLEPTAADNLFINILVPQTWEQIMASRVTVEAKPEEAAAWLALAQAYDAAVTTRAPTYSDDPYAALSEQTLARAVALSPDSPDLHTQLAWLKLDHLRVQALLPPNDPILLSILAELYQALTLDPTYKPALALLVEIEPLVDGPLLPVPPLRAWTIAADGAVFVLDAANVLFQLDPTDLTPIIHSAPLNLGAVSEHAPAHLLADMTHLFVGSQAVSQTLIFNRADFTLPEVGAVSEHAPTHIVADMTRFLVASQAISQTLVPNWADIKPVATLRHAGPMALDPDHHLFLISAQTSQLLAYNPADLNQLPQGIPVDCIPIDLAADPTGRRLYVREIISCGSSHHTEGYSAYDLDTLTEVRMVGGEASYGFMTRPAVIEKTGLGAGLYLPYDRYQVLFTFDGQSHILNQKDLPYLGASVALAGHGNWLYLSHERGLAVMRVDDLALQSFLPFTATIPNGLALSPDGERVYLFGDRTTTYTAAKLQRLGLAAVSPVPLAWTEAMNGDEAIQMRVYSSPDFAQDGVAFAQLLRAGNPFWAEVYRSDDSGHFKDIFPVLTSQVTALSFSPDFATDHTLVTDFRRSTDGGETWHGWSPPLAFVSEYTGNREIYTLEEWGTDSQRLTGNLAADENPAWSPAWTRLAFQSDRSGNWDIFSLRVECTPVPVECDLRQLTNDPADDTLPAWSPDGRQIAFVSLRDGNPEIYIMDKDGQNQRRLTFDPGADWRPAWLPDSQRLVFTSDRSGNNDIYLLTVPPPEVAPLTAEPPLTPVVTGPADDRDPAIGVSHQLASVFGFDAQNILFFSSDRAGAMKIYATLPDGSTTAVEPLVPADQGQAHPSWFQNILLVAVGEAGESDIYQLAPSDSPQAFITIFDFNGQPAGGPVWWQPDPIDLATLTGTATSTPAPTHTPQPAVTPTLTATLTPEPTPLPPLTSTASLTIPTLTPVGHLGGRMNVVFVHDGYAYLGMGSELAILDISNPAQPTRVGYLSQEVRDVEVAGHLAYIASYSGLQIVDVSVPTAPREIGFYQTPDYANGLTVVNNKVYLAGYDGLRILDVSDPTAPVELGFCALTQVISNDVVVRGDKAYVATANNISRTGGLSIVDVSGPARPGEISRLELDDLYAAAWEVGLVDNWVYIAAGLNGLPIINAADPTQPVQSRAVIKRTGPQEVGVSRLAVVNHYLYLTDGRSGLHIADIADPTQPVEVSFTPLPPQANDVTVVDDYAYVISEDGLHIFDVADPAAPRQAGQYLAPNGIVNQMAGQDHYLYLISTTEGLSVTNALNVIDVANPAWPVQVSRYIVPEKVWKVTIQGHYLYLAEEDRGQDHKGKIQIFDISNPISLTEVSSYDLPGPVFGLVVAGHYAYVDTGGLFIIDISNPAAPRQVTYAETLPGTIAAVAGDYAYALGRNRGLHVLDVSNPAAPVEVGVQAGGDEAWAAAVTGHYAYLGERTFGFRIIDISTPTAPVEVSAIEALGGKRHVSVEDMTVVGDRLYLLTSVPDGLHVFDISSPAQPVEIGLFPLSSAEEVVVRNGIIYVSCGSAGLYLFQATR